MNITESVSWKVCRFDELDAREVYLLAKLRVDVFVLEQACAYAELDGQDLLNDTVHVIGTAHKAPVAYARILAPRGIRAGKDQRLPQAVHIGRVVIEAPYRRHGLATMLMHHALEYCERHFIGLDQALAAQVNVEGFYTNLGFTACSEHYLEDGIAHVDMVRSAERRT